MPRRPQAGREGTQDRRHRPFLRGGHGGRSADRRRHRGRDRRAAPARRRRAADPVVAAARALDGLRPHHPSIRGLRNPREGPAAAAGGLRRDHPPPHARGRLHRGIRIRQGAAIAHPAVRGIPHGAERGRRADHDLELRPALPHRRRRGDRAHLRAAVPHAVQRGGRTRDRGADRLLQGGHPARHADRRPRVRRGDGLPHRLGLWRRRRLVRAAAAGRGGREAAGNGEVKMVTYPRDRFAYSSPFTRKQLRLTKGRMIGGAVVNIEEWEITRLMARALSQPPMGQFAVPDFPNWTWYEYGMRVGFWRLMRALKDAGVTPTMSINAKVCETYPEVAEAARAADWEFMAHSY